MKILIAEDDITSQTMLYAILSKWGYEVSRTADGQKAFAALQETGSPQLAILDWEMPGLDGPSLCRQLRRQNREEPLYLILLTARDEPRDIVLGLEAGADDYIAKPYDRAELQARINVGIRLLNLQNELREQGKIQGVLEMAGAVCHEINQPLQTVLGFSELLLMDMDDSDPKYDLLNSIKSGIDRIGHLTHKIMNITHYQSKPYLAGKIVDIEQASRK
ncbi:MAG: response regulator [Deltaproteobacteria bacterium]|nr:response regulator [Deltaproteobacteria bacterium]